MDAANGNPNAAMAPTDAIVEVRSCRWGPASSALVPGRYRKAQLANNVAQTSNQSKVVAFSAMAQRPAIGPENNPMNESTQKQIREAVEAALPRDSACINIVSWP